MSYLDISNLYKEQDILLFKEVWAAEKIHGTSAHVRYDAQESRPNDPFETEPGLFFFNGGENRGNFVKLFDQPNLIRAFKEMFPEPDAKVIVYGEAYGGKQQGMSGTYGKALKFIVFEVKVGTVFLSMEQAEDVAKKLGLEFVHYRKITTDLASLDAERDAPSEQAFRNGCADRNDQSTWKKREGVVLRPLIELRKNNGNRIICKHKGEDFKETKKQREVTDPAKLQVIKDAEAIAEEWCTPMRLMHVLDAFPSAGMENIPDIIQAMVADVMKESKGEIVDSKEARKAIGAKAVQLFKAHLKSQFVEKNA